MSDKSENSSFADTDEENSEDAESHSDSLEDDTAIDDSVAAVDENDIEKCIKNVKESSILDHVFAIIQKSFALRPDYSDVSPIFADEVPFLVDGDSLLVTIMDDENWSKQLGGAFLHAVYLFEQHLDIFVQRGGTFHLIFFDCWENVWIGNWPILLLRLSLIEHFSRNTETYPLHIFNNCYDDRFWNLVSTIRPGFILINSNAYIECNGITNIDCKYLQHMNNIQILSMLDKDLPCINASYIEEDIHQVFAFYFESNIAIKFIVKRFSAVFKNFMSKSFVQQFNCNVSNITDISEYDIRTLTYLTAGISFLNETKDQEILKVFFLKVAVMDCLGLQNRCCPLLNECLTDLTVAVETWHKHMYFALSKLTNAQCNWDSITDLWQGTLFGHVCRLVNNEIESSAHLGTNIAKIYENLILFFNNNFDYNVSAYPIRTSTYSINWNEYNPNVRSIDVRPLHRIDNPLVAEFCESIMDRVQWVEPPPSLFAQQEYTEEHHYHSMKVMYDEHDRIKNTVELMPTDPRALKKYMKQINLHARYMTIYGASIEGRSLEYSAVIRSGTKNKKEKEQKESKKAAEIKKKNIEKKINKEAQLSADQLKLFQAKYKDSNSKPATLLREINLIIDKTREDSVYKIDAYLWKLKTLLKATKISKDVKRDIFLTTRKVLSLRSGPNLSTKDQELLVKSLSAIDCLEIANCNGIKVDSKAHATPTWIRYQLEELGPDLERTTTGSRDSRVDGFIPDAWQQKLFDAVDRRQSAVIVAPTSSGKTYASYYCMQSVLKEGTEGVVVYVAPTKALVNQVAATVYARYKNTKMPDGKSVYGIFTRDFRTHALNCQILVTVPQCLELLLLSPRRHSWVQRLRYVIFDEIHCISGQMGGISWERCLLLVRCPFLALSATIRMPEQFHSWLQQTENYKYDQDVRNGCERKRDSYRVILVIHSERHSDLTKYTYGHGYLEHLHPYANLEKSVMKLHGGIPAHIVLSTSETLQLYDAMHHVNANCDDLKTQSPSRFFSEHCKNGFITRNLVRQYESILSKLLLQWYKNKYKDFRATVNHLTQTNIDGVEGTGRSYIQDNIVDFVLHLNEKNMLPAIIFAYDRGLINKMMEHVTHYFMRCDIGVDRRTEKKTNKLEKKQKKIAERNAPKEQESTSRPVNRFRSLNILSHSGNGLQGVGNVDSSDIEFIERRLRTLFKPKDTMIQAFRNGVGQHHGGFNNKIRSAVEMLFRMKVLNVVFATGTLALGIHMPCKTTVVAGNSPYLNSLEYHQMSGRAGRRGFDTAGNVVFLGVNPRKQHSLLTAHLPMIRGSFPLSVTIVLRLLLLVADVTEKGQKNESTLNYTVSRVMGLLENSMVYTERSSLKIQVKHFFSFTLQLLKIQEFINEVGAPLKWCGLATHLHYHEPGNLAFVYLLRSGCIRRICTEFDNVTEVEFTLLTVLSYLFTRIPLNPSSIKEFKNSKVILDPLPDYVEEALMTYNEQIRFVYDQYFANVAQQVSDDNVLPITCVQINPKETSFYPEDIEDNLQYKFLRLCPPKIICSSFSALSGNDDTNLYSENSATNNIKRQVWILKKSVPLMNLNIELNAYAVDFYRHGIIKSINEDNGLRSGADFQNLRDFSLVLKCIVVCLEEMGINEDDIVYTRFNTLSEKYGNLFSSVFK